MMEPETQSRRKKKKKAEENPNVKRGMEKVDEKISYQFEIYYNLIGSNRKAPGLTEAVGP